MVCLRKINVDTLHKEDTEDNNNNNNNIQWKQIILILKSRNIYGRKVDFVGSALINVACVFRRCVFF